MGFATWNAFHRHFTEQNFYDAADLMASNGMQAAGYEYINVVGLPPCSVNHVAARPEDVACFDATGIREINISDDAPK